MQMMKRYRWAAMHLDLKDSALARVTLLQTLRTLLAGSILCQTPMRGPAVVQSSRWQTGMTCQVSPKVT